jgi:LysM repeat protein
MGSRRRFDRLRKGGRSERSERASQHDHDGNTVAWEEVVAPADVVGPPSGSHRALALQSEPERRSLQVGGAAPDDVPVIITGTGISMGTPFITRRERPLTLRIAVLTLMVCILVTGLFAITPLGAGASGDNSQSGFQALAGAVIISRTVTFHVYIVQWGDEVETIAEKFDVEVGGIYQLNNLLAGQDLGVGTPLKIPDDPFYGKNYRPPTYVRTGSGVRFGDDYWTSLAGNPPYESPCAPNGNGDPMGYHLQPPNPHAAWVRGFSWYHNGDDLANPLGTPLHAAQAGQVIWAGWSVSGFGYSVKIDHCNHLSTLYGHMEQLLVKAGDYVDVGQVIGLEGSTGWSTGPHCHFSVFVDNNFVDPLAYFGWSVAAITA